MYIGLMDRVRCILLMVAGLRLNGTRAKQLDQELEYINIHIYVMYFEDIEYPPGYYQLYLSCFSIIIIILLPYNCSTL